jgi:hypothetical protein
LKQLIRITSSIKPPAGLEPAGGSSKWGEKTALLLSVEEIKIIEKN